jgi:hypothetical protein
LPGDTPVVFAPDIVSGYGLEHSGAIFSPGGDEVYWCSIEKPGSNSHKAIWFMRRIGNRWTTPRALDLFEDNRQIDVDAPFLSCDGNKLNVTSERNKAFKIGIGPDQWTRYLNLDIWYSERQADGWGKPRAISPLVNTDTLQAQASLTRDGTLYFLGFLAGVEQECGIFRSQFKNGAFLTPEAMPPSINSPAQDWTPFIAPDESYLLFSSTRCGGGDDGDLYVSFHDLKADSWSKPVSLGAPINTPAQERFQTVSPDGRYLFFTRWTPLRNADVFWVKTDVISRLRKNR